MKTRFLPLLTCVLLLATSCAMLKQERRQPELWRKSRPKSDPHKSPKIPKFEHFTLANGLSVMVAQNHHLPLVEVNFVSRVGSAKEDYMQAGLVNLSFKMLNEGTQSLTALELADAFSTLGTSVSVGVSRDSSTLSFPIMKKNLNEGLRLLSDMVLRPRFAQADFTRIKELQLSTIKANEANPNVVASNAFFATAYGPHHPYGHPTSGTLTSVAKRTLSEVKDFQRLFVGAKNSSLVFAGDITPKKAIDYANKYFSKLKPNPEFAKIAFSYKVNGPKTQSKMKLRLIERKNSPQTVLIVGRPLVRNGDPDIFAMQVFNEVVGGAFTSRINTNLRERKAWTYGAGSAIKPMWGLGPFYVQSSIQVPHTAEALKEVLNEFAKMRNTYVSDEELETAKNGLLLSLPGYFETNRSLARAAAGLFVKKLPLDYYHSWLRLIENVNADDVIRVAKRTLVDKQMTVVAVGDLEPMEKPISGYRLGQLQVKRANSG